MADALIQLPRLTCNRCGYNWIPRVNPVQCPKCKSYNWNKLKDFDKRKKEFKEEKFKFKELKGGVS